MDQALKPIILVAEDDEDHFLLIREAIEAAKKEIEIKWVKDGEELLRYLNHEGEYLSSESSPLPSLILLDLNMPRKDGREALYEIKSSEKLKAIPVIVLTTSKNAEDIHECYARGANAFLRKPSRYQEFIDLMKVMIEFWLGWAERP